MAPKGQSLILLREEWTVNNDPVQRLEESREDVDVACDSYSSASGKREAKEQSLRLWRVRRPSRPGRAGAVEQGERPA